MATRTPARNRVDDARHEVPVPQRLMWNTAQVAAMFGHTASYIEKRRDPETGLVEIDGGATIRMFKAAKNGQWVAYRAQVERALAEHGEEPAR